mmetsp:Transcript_34582/g.75587  ORF Transcript_34582/g.75587 Transcript_34582/m.75587 type:complete len:817 (-) Transcript_34582:480-2930(-)
MYKSASSRSDGCQTDRQGILERRASSSLLPLPRLLPLCVALLRERRGQRRLELAVVLLLLLHLLARLRGLVVGGGGGGDEAVLVLVDVAHALRLERALPQELRDVLQVQHLPVEECQRHLLDQVLAVLDELHRRVVELVHHLTHLGVDDLGGVLAVGLVQAVVVGREGEEAHLLVHAVHRHLVVGELGDLLEVVLRAGGDLADEHLLGGAAAQRHADHVRHLLARHQQVLARQVLREPQRRRPARHDGHLEEGLGVLEEPADDGVARLVVGDGAALVGGDHLVLLLQPPDDAVHRLLKVPHPDRLLAGARRHEGRLVADVGDVRAGEAGGEGGEALRVVLLVLVQLELLQVHLEDLLAPLDVRPVDGDLTVEPPRPQQRLVQDVRPVRARQNHHPGGGGKAVHLHEELVESVLALVVGAREPLPSARAADGVDLVDEDDGGALLAGLREEVAHAGGPHPHEHLHEVAPADGQEGHPRLARRRLGQQRLARAGGAHQERPLRHLAAQVLVLPRVLQEAHELHHLRLRLVAPGHVLEHHLGLGVLVEGADRRLAHGEDAAPPAHAAAAAAHAAAHLAPREPQPPREEEQGGRQADHLRLPAHLRGVHHRQVAARVDAHDVLRLLQLALEGLDAANVEEELVGGLAVGVGDEAHLARGAVGANVHLGNRLVQDLDFLNHTLLEELVLEFLEADFLCFRTIQEERHRGETKESPCYQQLLCRLVCQNIAEALSLLLSPWWCLIWFLLAATIGALVLGIKVLEAVLLGCVRESATERPWGRLGPDLRQFWKLPHHVRPTGKRCQSATGKRARSCSSVLHPS